MPAKGPRDWGTHVIGPVWIGDGSGLPGQDTSQVLSPVMAVNAKAYGAVGNGSTDDTAAIQAAVTAAGATGVVVFPPTASTYVVGSSITNASNVPLVFWGSSGRFSGAGAPTANVLAIGASAAVGNSLHTELAATGALRLPVGTTGASTFLRAALSGNGAVGHYNFAIGQAANAGDVNRNDHVLTVGYNTTTLGGRADLTEPAFEWRIEDYYQPIATPYVEAHWQYYDATGAGYRPIACQINRTNGGYLTDATLAFMGTSISILAANNVQYFKFSQGQLEMLNSAIIAHGGNNVQLLRQMNAESTHMNSLIYTDASNRVLIGDGSAGGTTHYWLYSVSTTPMMGWGGMTSSFPALKRSGTILQARLADDSAYTTLDVLGLKASGSAGANFGPAHPASITVVNGIVTAVS